MPLPRTSGSRITQGWGTASNSSSLQGAVSLLHASSSHQLAAGGPGDGAEQGRTGENKRSSAQGHAPKSSRDKPPQSISWARVLGFAPNCTAILEALQAVERCRERNRRSRRCVLRRSTETAPPGVAKFAKITASSSRLGGDGRADAGSHGVQVTHQLLIASISGGIVGSSRPLPRYRSGLTAAPGVVCQEVWVSRLKERLNGQRGPSLRPRSREHLTPNAAISDVGEQNRIHGRGGRQPADSSWCVSWGYLHESSLQASRARPQPGSGCSEASGAPAEARGHPFRGRCWG